MLLLQTDVLRGNKWNCFNQSNVLGGNKLDCFKAMQVLGGPTQMLHGGPK